MKMLSTALIVFGLGLSAAYGAKNADPVVERQAALGKADLLNQASAKLLKELQTDMAKESDSKATSIHEHRGTPEWTEKKARFDALSTEAGLAAHAATGFEVVENPGVRFTNWMDDAGLPFGLGIIMLVIGAVLARTQAREAASGVLPREYKGGRVAEAVDFGVLLSQLQSDVAAAAARASATSAPEASDFKELRYLVKNLQFDKLEHLIESRGRVQSKYGVAGFASIFGPLSAGERQLNRAWSALVDLHWGEAVDSLSRCANSLRVAVAEVEQRSDAQDGAPAPAA